MPSEIEQLHNELTAALEKEWLIYCNDVKKCKDWSETKLMMEDLWPRMASVAISIFEREWSQ